MSPGPGSGLRVVLDSNVLISALGFQKETKKVWDLVEAGRFTLLVSPFVIDELRRGLVARAGLSSAQAEDIVEEVLDVAEAVAARPSGISAIKADLSDNAILECAVQGKADAIVTGDLKHIRPLGRFRGIAILTPREFIDRHFPEA